MQEENLFDDVFFTPEYFSQSQMDIYYLKIKKTNPNIELRKSIELSKDMLNILHKIMCSAVVNFPQTELAIEHIHWEGHAFKVRFEEKCQSKHHGIHGVSLSVNGFENDDIVRRHRELDYNVSFVLNDSDGKIVYDKKLGFNYSKVLNRGPLKDTMKLVFEEIDKVMNYRQDCIREKEISYMIDSLFSDN
jgi:hypothetical protein